MSVPKLRFKEFSGDWEKKTLELLCEAEAPITYGVLKPGDYFEGGTPLIKILNKTLFDVCQTKFKNKVHSSPQEFLQLSLQKHHPLQHLCQILDKLQF